MSAPLRILITGFGTFPGAPFNPTPQLVSRLMRMRRPALADIALSCHIFEVRYRAVDRDLPRLIAERRPDALLMFGLASRTPHMRIETRARNAVTMIWPDAGGVHVGKRSIAGIDEAAHFGPLTARLVRAAQAAGVDARLSRDAGSYLCNYLSWRALEAHKEPGGPAIVSFIHVPLTAHDGGRWRGMASRMTMDEMAKAAEALLLETVKATRQTRRILG